MKNRIVLIIASSFVLFFSCEKEVTSPKDRIIHIGNSEHILPNYYITSIDFDSEGTAWIGTFKQGILKYNGSATYYHSENSSLPDSIVVWDLTVDRNDVVWIGSDSGLIKYDGNNFIVYNTSNSPLAEDVVWSIAADDDNVLWLASCRFRQGGLMTFDGTNWTLYTPENSELPSNGIRDIVIDSRNTVWFTNNDAVYSNCIVRINNDNWTIFDKDDFGFDPYYFGLITVDTEDRIYATLDYSLSSHYDNSRPNIIKFDDENWSTIFPTENTIDSLTFNGNVNNDNDGNIWTTLFNKDGLVLSAYDGENWTYYYPDIPSVSISDIVFDSNNTMWLGTGNGIFLIKQ